MLFITKLKIAFFYGRAIMRFHQKRYNDALRLFKNISQYETEFEKLDYTYFYLGRCYFELNNYDEAFKAMTKAYEIFCKSNRLIDSEDEKKEVKNFLQAYSTLLMQIGKLEYSKKIAREADSI